MAQKIFHKIYQLFNPESKAYPIFCFIIIGVMFAFSNMWSSFFVGNERDTLMVAKQFVQKDWIPFDWYLNQDFGYRNLFNLVFGVLTYLPIKMEYLNFGVRLLVYAAFSVGFVRLMLVLKIPLLLFVPLFYHYTKNPVMFAGEAITSSLEAKVFAYVFAVLSLDCLLRNKHRMMMLFLGLSFSFHVLVGFYATLCACTTMMLFDIMPDKGNKEKIFSAFTYNKLKEKFFNILKITPFFLITSVFGLYMLINYTIENRLLSAAEKEMASLIYITFRVPHHTYLFYFRTANLLQVIPYALLYILCLIFLRKTKNLLAKKVCFYISVAFACVCLGITFTLLNSDVSLLKFYWFRYFDSMGAVLSPFVLGYLLYKPYMYVQNKWGAIAIKVAKKTISLKIILRLICSGIAMYLCFTFLSEKVVGFNRGLKSKWQLSQAGRIMPAKSLQQIEAFKWVKNNTPKNSLFLLHANEKSFYYYAERPRLVSIKHSPQSDKHILEWFQRVKDISFEDSGKQIGLKTYKQLSQRRRSEEMISKKASAKRNLVKKLNDYRIKLGLKPLVSYYPVAFDITEIGKENHQKFSASYLQKLKEKYGNGFSAVYYLIKGERDSNFPLTRVFYNKKYSIYKF